MKAQWLDVWRITYRVQRGDAWSEPMEVHVAAGKDGSDAADRLKAAIVAGGNPPDAIRVVSMENKLRRVALFAGTAWEWKDGP